MNGMMGHVEPLTLFAACTVLCLRAVVGLDYSAFEGIDFVSEFGKFTDGITGTCHFSCPNGAVAMRDPGYTPTSNGCGSYGFELDTSDFPALGSCCDVHDHCYGTCGKDKVRCDSAFKRCLRGVCQKMADSGLLNDDYQQKCIQGSDILYAGTIALGCSAYLQAQKEACLCNHSKRGSRRKKIPDEF